MASSAMLVLALREIFGDDPRKGRTCGTNAMAYMAKVIAKCHRASGYKMLYCWVWASLALL
eukprot:5593419-Alexandrium_andersonii.AAC.1